MLNDFLSYRVADFMSRSGIVVTPETSLAEAQRLFERHDFNLLPVVIGARFVGVLTKLDFLKAFRFQPDHVIPPYRAILERPVGDVMSSEVDTFAPDSPLTHVLERMVETRHRSFPVVLDGSLVGVISRGDLVRAIGTPERGRQPSISSSSIFL